MQQNLETQTSVYNLNPRVLEWVDVCRPPVVLGQS